MHSIRNGALQKITSTPDSAPQFSYTAECKLTNYHVLESSLERDKDGGSRKVSSELRAGSGLLIKMWTLEGLPHRRLLASSPGLKSPSGGPRFCPFAARVANSGLENSWTFQRWRLGREGLGRGRNLTE